ncbi:response regulator [Starkeya sp. ORNL1]|nr:response regulator [Starkeya sp. ORNL1]
MVLHRRQPLGLARARQRARGLDTIRPGNDVNTTTDETPPRKDRRIFIVEDESLVAMMIEAMVEELGARVAGTHNDIKGALAFVATSHTEIDAAVLDLNLGGQRSYDIAAALLGHGIPVVFSTGYDDGAIPAEWRHVPRLSKPFQLDELAQALDTALTTRLDAAQS